MKYIAALLLVVTMNAQAVEKPTGEARAKLEKLSYLGEVFELACFKIGAHLHLSDAYYPDNAHCFVAEDPIDE